MSKRRVSKLIYGVGETNKSSKDTQNS